MMVGTFLSGYFAKSLVAVQSETTQMSVLRPTSDSKPSIWKSLNRTTVLNRSTAGPARQPSTERPLPTTSTPPYVCAAKAGSSRQAARYWDWLNLRDRVGDCDPSDRDGDCDVLRDELRARCSRVFGDEVTRLDPLAAFDVAMLRAAAGAGDAAPLDVSHPCKNSTTRRSVRYACAAAGDPASSPVIVCMFT